MGSSPERPKNVRHPSEHGKNQIDCTGIELEMQRGKSGNRVAGGNAVHHRDKGQPMAGAFAKDARLCYHRL
jgi:hypothetical protein